MGSLWAWSKLQSDPTVMSNLLTTNLISGKTSSSSCSHRGRPCSPRLRSSRPLLSNVQRESLAGVIGRPHRGKGHAAERPRRQARRQHEGRRCR